MSTDQDYVSDAASRAAAGGAEDGQQDDCLERIKRLWWQRILRNADSTPPKAADAEEYATLLRCTAILCSQKKLPGNPWAEALLNVSTFREDPPEQSIFSALLQVCSEQGSPPGSELRQYASVVLYRLSALPADKHKQFAGFFDRPGEPTAAEGLRTVVGMFEHMRQPEPVREHAGATLVALSKIHNLHAAMMNDKLIHELSGALAGEARTLCRDVLLILGELSAGANRNYFARGVEAESSHFASLIGAAATGKDSPGRGLIALITPHVRLHPALP